MRAGNPFLRGIFESSLEISVRNIKWVTLVTIGLLRGRGTK